MRRLLKALQGLDSERRAPIEAAWSAARHDEGELGRCSRPKAVWMGTRKAVVVLARKPLTVAWRMLRTGEPDRIENPATVQRKQWVVRRWTDAVRTGGGSAAGAAGPPGPSRWGIGLGGLGGSEWVPPGGGLTAIRRDCHQK